MRKFRISIEGKTYEVEVEEIKQAGTTPVVPKVEAPKEETPKSQAATETKNTKASPAPSGGEVVKAPLPGTVLQVKVSPGQQVAAGDVLMILEAMKMENEVLAPVGGTVNEIFVSQGQSVGTGDVLVSIG